MLGKRVSLSSCEYPQKKGNLGLNLTMVAYGRKGKNRSFEETKKGSNAISLRLDKAGNIRLGLAKQICCIDVIHTENICVYFESSPFIIGKLQTKNKLVDDGLVTDTLCLYIKNITDQKIKINTEWKFNLQLTSTKNMVVKDICLIVQKNNYNYHCRDEFPSVLMMNDRELCETIYKSDGPDFVVDKITPKLEFKYHENVKSIAPDKNLSQNDVSIIMLGFPAFGFPCSTSTYPPFTDSDATANVFATRIDEQLLNDNSLIPHFAATQAPLTQLNTNQTSGPSIDDHFEPTVQVVVPRIDELLSYGPVILPFAAIQEASPNQALNDVTTCELLKKLLLAPSEKEELPL